MEKHKYLSNLKWKHIISNLNHSISDMFTDNNYSDVTLVSDDKIPFQAHRYVLSAFSPVLKNILLSNPHSHPLIYLSGVSHEELNSILQFIYLGVASINYICLDKFFQAAVDLQIKNVAENIKDGPKHNLDEDIADGNTNLDTPGNVELVFDKIAEHGQGMCLYKCDKCEATYKSKIALNTHNRRKHIGIVYPCKYCQYKATTQNDRKVHQESIHEGLRFACDMCEYQASQQTHLRIHKKAVHLGVRYFCNQCAHQFTDKGYLKKHQQSVHGGVKYACNQCDYQATQQCNLRTHQKSAHEGVKYCCDQCDYHTGFKHQLKVHIERKHSVLA